MAMTDECLRGLIEVVGKNCYRDILVHRSARFHGTFDVYIGGVLACNFERRELLHYATRVNLIEYIRGRICGGVGLVEKVAALEAGPWGEQKSEPEAFGIGYWVDGGSLCFRDVPLARKGGAVPPPRRTWRRWFRGLVERYAAWRVKRIKAPM